jgi:hypothetical protein
MTEKSNRQPTAKPYQGKKKQRWPTRIVVALVSVGGLLGLWQFVAHEPPAAAHETPSFEDAEQQLQLGPASTNNNNDNNGSVGSSSGNSPSSGVLPPPDTLSGSS